ncbi:MAG: YihY/virulence factor BrkB family protein [Gemmatimonadales bacterium]
MSDAPAFSVRARVLDTLDRANLPLLASALTFDALLAIIPLAILLVAAVSYLLTSAHFASADPTEVINRLLPVHAHSGANDPFAVIERLLGELRGYRSKLTWIALPLWLWFSTRVFAAVRVCLSSIFQVRARPVKGHFVWSYIAGYLLGKARDLAIVFVVLLLALGNTITTAALALVDASGVERDPRWDFLLTTGGRLAGHGIELLFGVVLFVVLYRYASPKRLAWPGALIASVVGTLGFELAKRLYGFYLMHSAHGGQYSVDADIGAVLLLILWIWYMSLVFLIGAAVADVWDHARQLRQVEHGKVSL